jgi:hypothetical protein
MDGQKARHFQAILAHLRRVAEAGGGVHGAQGRNRTTDTAIFSLCRFAFVSLLDTTTLEIIAIFSQLVC